MALFKSLWGKRQNLPDTKTAGYAYFCTDDATFHIDYNDEDGNLQRKQINAKDAETLTGASLSTTLKSSNVEIPTSQAVSSALSEKADKIHIHNLESFPITDTVTGAQYNLYVTNSKLTLVKVGEGVITGYEDGDGVTY